MDSSQIRIEQLKQFIDYTKFHIGLYLTLIGAIVTLLGIELPKLRESNLSSAQRWGFFCAFTVVITFFLLAGVCGAIVVSKLLDPYGLYNFWIVEKKGRGNVLTVPNFLEKRVGIGPIEFPIQYWATLEHWFFWMGLFIALLTLLWMGVTTLKPQIPPCKGELNREESKSSPAVISPEAGQPEEEQPEKDAK